VTTLVDANVLLDIITEDAVWYGWSADALIRVAAEATVAVNPIIYAEVSLAYDTIEALDDAMQGIERRDLPYEAGFLATRCFQSYRRSGGARRSPLPDFYIGAHAAVRGYRLPPSRF